MCMSEFSDTATHIRRLIVQMTTAAGSGHLTSSLSCVDILTILFGRILRYDPNIPKNIFNDRFVLSKGHAAPALYATYAACNWLTEAECMTLRTKSSRLEGHPMTELPYIDAATGSLGQGLGIGLGLSFGTQELDPQPMVYVLMGDGELAEGSVWEAMADTISLNVHNLCAIIDLNGMGQSGPSLYSGNLELLTRRMESFGWRVHTVDGHDLDALAVVLGLVTESPGPHAVICNTVKGKGISFLENKEGWHGRALNETQAQQALEELGNPRFSPLRVKKPLRTGTIERAKVETDSLPPTFLAATAARASFGMACADLAVLHSEFLGIDGDVKNSTGLDKILAKTPRQLIELSIAESTMIEMAVGLSVVGKRPIPVTFAAFLTRCYDQLRMAAIGKSSFVFAGTHVGVSIGKDGASQMGLEDIALMRNLPGCTILYPSDAYSAYSLTREAFNQPGLTYLRLTREPVTVLYSQTTKFPVGGSHLHGPSDQDKATIVAAGITLFEALKAQKSLREKGILVRVIDLYSVRPIDEATLIDCVKRTGNRLVVVEDHHAEGGIGEEVAWTLSGLPLIMKHMAVRGIPHSGTINDTLESFNLDAASIERAVEELVK